MGQGQQQHRPVRDACSPASPEALVGQTLGLALCDLDGWLTAPGLDDLQEPGRASLPLC